jgi:glutathione peroxidase
MSSSIFNIEINSINGEPDVLGKLRGNVVLITNIASKAGYEPVCSKVWSYARTARQLWELQQLHEMFADRGFSVLGVPCNQFHRMEPLGNQEINDFIKSAYPFVTFPIAEKVEVNGENEHPLFSALKGSERRRSDDNRANDGQSAIDGQNRAGQALARVPSNYEKFIIGRRGEQVFRFRFTNWPLANESLTLESDLTIKAAIESIL